MADQITVQLYPSPSIQTEILPPPVHDVNLVFPQGPPGQQGPPGPQGIPGATGPISIITSETEPTPSVEGMVWFDSASLRTYLRYDNTWVEYLNGYSSTEKTKRYASDSADSQIYYIGKAFPGTADSDSGWTIKRTTLNNSGSVLATASAFGIWNNRESLTYQ